MITFPLKSGKYIISDPCYLFPDGEWTDFCNCIKYGNDPYQPKNGNCESIYPQNSDSAFEMKYKVQSFYVIPTAYGDGGYDLKENRKSIGILGVDAGLLSVIPFELFKTWPDFEKLKDNDLGITIELEKDEVLKCSKGNFKLGKFSVKTN